MGATRHLNGVRVIAPQRHAPLYTYYADGRGNILRMCNSAYVEKFPQYYAACKVLNSALEQVLHNMTHLLTYTALYTLHGALCEYVATVLFSIFLQKFWTTEASQQ